MSSEHRSRCIECSLDTSGSNKVRKCSTSGSSGMISCDPLGLSLDVACDDMKIRKSKICLHQKCLVNGISKICDYVSTVTHVTLSTDAIATAVLYHVEKNGQLPFLYRILPVVRPCILARLQQIRLLVSLQKQLYGVILLSKRLNSPLHCSQSCASRDKVD